jgi:hypothetical protein
MLAGIVFGVGMAVGAVNFGLAVSISAFVPVVNIMPNLPIFHRSTVR